MRQARPRRLDGGHLGFDAVPGRRPHSDAAQRARDAAGAIFFLDRAKTGRAAIGTLTPWSEAVLRAYVKSLGFELHADAPIFRTAGSAKGGRRWAPRPYTIAKM